MIKVCRFLMNVNKDEVLSRNAGITADRLAGQLNTARASCSCGEPLALAARAHAELRVDRRLHERRDKYSDHHDGFRTNRPGSRLPLARRVVFLRRKRAVLCPTRSAVAIDVRQCFPVGGCCMAVLRRSQNRRGRHARRVDRGRPERDRGPRRCQHTAGGRSIPSAVARRGSIPHLLNARGDGRSSPGVRRTRRPIALTCRSALAGVAIMADRAITRRRPALP